MLSCWYFRGVTCLALAFTLIIKRQMRSERMATSERSRHLNWQMFLYGNQGGPSLKSYFLWSFRVKLHWKNRWVKRNPKKGPKNQSGAALPKTLCPKKVRLVFSFISWLCFLPLRNCWGRCHAGDELSSHDVTSMDEISFKWYGLDILD